MSVNRQEAAAPGDVKLGYCHIYLYNNIEHLFCVSFICIAVAQKLRQKLAATDRYLCLYVNGN